MVDRCDVLAIGAHPDDVELGCGATIARVTAAGRSVGIVDLTAGELATRGTVECRAAEAEVAREALGATWRICLRLGDGRLSGEATEALERLVEVLRTAAPRTVLVHHEADPHPDHQAVAQLARRAAFFGGVARWGLRPAPPHRPELFLAYPGPRQLLLPDLVVDVTRWYGAKRVALAAHASQFDPVDGAPTHLASGHFLAAIEGRDRACGNLIGCEFGEGFSAPGTLAANEVARLLGGAT